MPGSTKPMTSAGAGVAISTSLPATITEAGYAALTYQNIAGITDAGSLGRSYATVSHNPTSRRGEIRLKGSFDDGSMTLVMANELGDTGQAMLADAVDDDGNYAFRLTLSDGSATYFLATVVSAPEDIGDVDTVFGLTATLEIQGRTIVTPSQGGGVSPFAFTYQGQLFTFAGVAFTYGAPA